MTGNCTIRNEVSVFYSSSSAFTMRVSQGFVGNKVIFTMGTRELSKKIMGNKGT